MAYDPNRLRQITSLKTQTPSIQFDPLKLKARVSAPTIEPEEEEGIGEYARKTLAPTPRSVLGLFKGGAGAIGKLAFPAARPIIDTLVPETKRAEAMIGMVGAPSIAAIGAVEAGAAPVLKRYIRGEPGPEIRRKAPRDISKGIIDNLAVLLGTKEKALTLGEVATEAAPEKLGPFKFDTPERKAVFGQMVETLPYLAAAPGMVRGAITKAGKLGKEATARAKAVPTIAKERGLAKTEVEMTKGRLLSRNPEMPEATAEALAKQLTGRKLAGKDVPVIEQMIKQPEVLETAEKTFGVKIPREKALATIEQRLSERMAPKAAKPVLPPIAPEVAKPPIVEPTGEQGIVELKIEKVSARNGGGVEGYIYKDGKQVSSTGRFSSIDDVRKEAMKQFPELAPVAKGGEIAEIPFDYEGKIPFNEKLQKIFRLQTKEGQVNALRFLVDVTSDPAEKAQIKQMLKLAEEGKFPLPDERGLPKLSPKEGKVEIPTQIFRISEPTNIVNTQGKTIILPKGEEYRVIPLKDNKVKLIDGKQITVYEGELDKLKGQILPEGEQPIAGGTTRKINAEDLTDDVLERLPLYSRQVLTKRIIEGKSYEQTLKEVGTFGDTIEDIKEREKEAIADIGRIRADIEKEREAFFEEKPTEFETEQKAKLKSYFATTKFKAYLKDTGEFANIKLLPQLFAKEDERGVTPDDMISELNEMGFNIPEDDDQEVLRLVERTFASEIQQKAGKAAVREEKTFAKQQKSVIEKYAKFTGRKERPPKRQEVDVGSGSIINTPADIDGAERNRILTNMPIWLAGNKAEVLSRLSPQLKVELTKGIEEVYDLFGGAKGYRVGLFDKIVGEKYHLNELSDERYNLYNNLKDPQKVAVIKQTVVNLRDELIREIADAFGIDPNIYSPEALRNALNKWLERGLHRERYDFARKAIQTFGDRLLQEAQVDNFKSPESSAKYYFLQNTSIFGIGKTAKGYNWTQGIIRTSADKSSIRDTMGRVVNVDTLLTNELNRDKNIIITQEDAWGLMDKIAQDIKAGKIAPEKTAVLIDPQYLNPTQKEGTYVAGQEDATWEGHKKNLEQHLLPLYNTGIKIIYTNNEDINLTKWLRSYGLPYNVEEKVGIVAQKGGRDEIISFANYRLPAEYTARVSPVAGRLQPGQYIPEEITGESPRFTEYLREKYAGEQEVRQKQLLIEKIKDVQAKKLLSNTTISRLKQYFNVREMKNAKLPILQDLIDYLETFKEGDAFLSEKQFAALYDIIKEIPDVAITPKRIIFDKLGAQEEILSTGLSGKIPLEMFPTVDIKEGHPVVRNIVDRIEIRMNQAEQEIARRDKQFEQMIRKAEQARAGQIRVSERLRRTIVPQNIEIFRALGGDRVFLEKEEVAVVAYLKNFFKKVRDDLQLEKYRKRYVTHLEQTLSEKILTQGLIPAVADIFKLRQKETIPIDIFLELDNIIGSEKFFKFALPRTGGISPTTDLRRIVHAYSSLYETKKALDETLPEGQAIVKTLLQPKTAQWMKRYLQNLKGRGLDFNFRTGRMGWLPKVADQIVDLGYLKLLGLNYWSALKNLAAGEANSFIYQPFKNFLIGKQRLISNPKKAIKMAQENFVLEGTYADYAQQGIKKLRKVRDLFMIGQKAGEYEIRTSLFVGELTDKEWETGEIDPQHLQRIKDTIAITQGIFSKTQSPLWMQTWYGRMFMQMNRWRVTNAMLVGRLIKEKNYKGLSKAFILYGIGMYIAYQFAKAGYKKAAKVAQASAETINSIIEAVTLKPIYDAITDNPTLSALGELVYTIQEVANYIGVPGIEEPRKIEFKRGIEKTWISPIERTKELLGITKEEEPRSKFSPKFSPSKFQSKFTGKRF